jgi:GNAT superfamily N-acetyltransferase
VTSNVLADEVVWVWAVLPDDHERLRAMFSRVSSETIYRRFHTPYPRVPEWLLEFPMDAVGRGGRSLAAVVGEEIVGHAMCSRPEAGGAEVAIVVEDRWQSRGVGPARGTLLKTVNEWGPYSAATEGYPNAGVGTSPLAFSCRADGGADAF